MIKSILRILAVFALCATVDAAEVPPPGSSGNLACNVGGFWAPCAVSTGLNLAIGGGAGTLSQLKLNAASMAFYGW